MENVTKPKVKLLASGDALVAKQMQANKGELLPAHLATVESILFVHEGECIFTIEGKEKELKEGDSIIVPPKIRHQIKAKSDFKGVHFMPKNIQFEFFD